MTQTTRVRARIKLPPRDVRSARARDYPDWVKADSTGKLQWLHRSQWLAGYNAALRDVRKGLKLP